MRREDLWLLDPWAGAMLAPGRGWEGLRGRGAALDVRLDARADDLREAYDARLACTLSRGEER